MNRILIRDNNMHRKNIQLNLGGKLNVFMKRDYIRVVPGINRLPYIPWINYAMHLFEFCWWPNSTLYRYSYNAKKYVDDDRLHILK